MLKTGNYDTSSHQSANGFARPQIDYTQYLGNICTRNKRQRRSYAALFLSPPLSSSLTPQKSMRSLVVTAVLLLPLLGGAFFPSPHLRLSSPSCLSIRLNEQRDGDFANSRAQSQPQSQSRAQSQPQAQSSDGGPRTRSQQRPNNNAKGRGKGKGKGGYNNTRRDGNGASSRPGGTRGAYRPNGNGGGQAMKLENPMKVRRIKAPRQPRDARDNQRGGGRGSRPPQQERATPAWADNSKNPAPGGGESRSFGGARGGPPPRGEAPTRGLGAETRRRDPLRTGGRRG